MTTPAKAQDEQKPLWVQDLLAWLEKIKALRVDKQAEAIEELLAELLPTRASVLHEALAAAREIQDEAYRVYYLVEVAPHLPATDPQLLHEALDAAHEIQDEAYRAQALAAVTPHLPENDRQPVLCEALDTTHEIRHEGHRAQALTDVAAHLPGNDPQLLHAALVAAREINAAQALAAVALHLPESDRQPVLHEALVTAREYGSDTFRAQALAAVAAYLPATDPQLLYEALDAAREIQGEADRALALAAVAAHLPESDRQPVLHEALAVAREIRDDEWGRTHALAAVVPHLPESDRQPVLYAALAVAREIQDVIYRARALAAVAPHLPEIDRQSVLHEALDAARKIQDVIYRVQALADVAAHLPEIDRQSVLHEALDAAREIQNVINRSQALAEVAARLPATDPELLDEALDAAREFQNAVNQAIVLAAVAPHLPESDRQPVLQEALTAAARQLRSEPIRVPVLAAVAPHLPLQSALEILQEIRAKESRVSVLSAFAFNQPENLIPQLPSAEFSTVLETVARGKTTAEKTKLLSALAPQLSPGLFPKALDLHRDAMPHPAYQAESLSNLATYLPPEQLSEALELIDTSIPGFSYRTTALCNLMPFLSLPQLDRALDIAINHIRIPGLTTQILRAAATRLAQLNTDDPTDTQSDAPEPKSSLTQKILARIQPEITAEKDKMTILTALAPSLQTDAHFRQVQTWLAPGDADVSGIHSEDCRADILAALAQAPQLARKQLAPFQELAQNLRQAGPKAQALSAFIPKFPEARAAVYGLLDHPAATNNSIRRADIAVALACRLHPAESNAAALMQLTTDQSRALRTIRDLVVDLPKASYLKKLAPHLLPSQSLEAQDIAQDIQSTSLSAKALIALAAHFPAVRSEALHQVRQVQNQDRVHGIELLSQLATIVPEHIPALLKEIETGESPPEASTASQDTVDYNHQRILMALKPHLPIRLDREIERHTRSGEVPRELWNRALYVLRRDYHKALKSGSLRNDAARGEDLLDLKDEIHALADMLLMRDLEPPVAVGILGGWGEGKSYILHLMQTRMVEIRSQGLDEIAAWGIDPAREKTLAPVADRLNRYVGHIYQINFDAWTYAKSNLWASLMQTIFFELDRQITLEQQLKEAGLNFFGDEDSKIWQALYETSDDDRKWLLENVLNSRPDIFEKWQQQAQIPRANDQLWALFAASQMEAFSNLKEVERELEQQKEALCETRSRVLEKGLQTALLSTTVRVSANRLKSGLGSSFEQEIIQKAAQAMVYDAKGKSGPSYSSIKEDIERFFEKQDSSIDIKFLLQFVRKNVFLVAVCGLLLLGAILLPLGLAQLGFKSLIQQIIAAVTPLLSVFPIAHRLLKKGQTLYAEVKVGITDFKQQLEQGIQRRLDTDEEFRRRNRQVQLLEKEVAAQYEAIPTNVYASIAEFVSDRLKSGGYQEHLGLMHQVKEDLAMLSKRLLPPPADSTEYLAKINQLREVFPRGPARVVLYIDDLDRCPPDIVVEVLEAVQLLVKNPLFIAVLAIDERYINRTLAQHYKGVLSRQGRPSASDYLEKIIQIPYRVRPPAEQALRNYLRAQVVIQDSETSGTKFNEVSPQEFDLLVDCCRQVDLSPRSIKRLTNVYKLYKVLSRTRGHKRSPREQKTIITLLAFSGRYPDLMRDIQHDITSRYEEGRHLFTRRSSPESLGEVFGSYFSKCKQEGRYRGTYLAEELAKLEHDAQRLITTHIELSDIRSLFDFVRTFSFVGDIGQESKH